ncbi:MAG: cytochrome c oxidase subunit 3 [Terriglobales bacterium]
MATQSQGWEPGAALPKFRRAVWLGMIAMTMFFLALTLAYIVRHGLNVGWLSPQLATILSANTFILLASSLALWRAHQFLRARQPRAMLRWLGTALGLGVLFLAGQAFAWRSLLLSGVYIAGHPNSGFFYIVTATHAAHICVALGLLAWVFSRAWRGRMSIDRPLALDLTSIIWHCLDVTWVYLFLVLLFYR